MHKYKKHIKELNSAHFKTAPEELIASLLLEIFPNEHHILVAVGGPGGTGKSSFCAKLAALLPDSNILHLDDYKTPRETRRDLNIFGAHPEANMIDLVLEHYKLAKSGKSFEKPLYNAVTGKADQTEYFETRRFTVIDGEISTYKQFRDYVDFSIFIDSDLETQLKTRLDRDIKVRQYTYEKAIATFLHSNLREFAEYGAESKNWADVHLYCHNHYELSFESIAEDYFDLFQRLSNKIFKSIDIQGLVEPLLIPFTPDGTYIDREALIRELEYLSQSGIERIHAGGYHSEVFSLSLEERIQLMLLCKRFFNGLAFFDISSEKTSESLILLREANKVGIDMLTVMPAWHWLPLNIVNAEFSKLAELSEIPILLDMRFIHTGNDTENCWTQDNHPVSNEYDISLLKQALAAKINFPITMRD